MVLCNDGVVLCNVFLPCSIRWYSVICTVPELGGDWVGVLLGHTAHPYQRLLGEEKDNMFNVEHSQVWMGRGRWRGRERRWMRTSERVGWSEWLCKQGSACVCMCVLVCTHACMHAVGGLCCFSTYVGLSICKLCCYRCVSMDTLSHVAALKTQHQSLCL